MGLGEREVCLRKGKQDGVHFCKASAAMLQCWSHRALQASHGQTLVYDSTRPKGDAISCPGSKIQIKGTKYVPTSSHEMACESDIY